MTSPSTWNRIDAETSLFESEDDSPAAGQTSPEHRSSQFFNGAHRAFDDSLINQEFLNLSQDYNRSIQVAESKESGPTVFYSPDILTSAPVDMSTISSKITKTIDRSTTADISDPILSRSKSPPPSISLSFLPGGSPSPYPLPMTRTNSSELMASMRVTAVADAAIKNGRSDSATVERQIHNYIHNTEIRKTADSLWMASSLRDLFLTNYPKFKSTTVDSSCCSTEMPGKSHTGVLESREPKYQPHLAPILDNLAGRVNWHRGVAQILWNTRDDGAVVETLPLRVFVVHRGYIGDNQSSIHLSCTIPDRSHFQAALEFTMSVTSHPAAKQFSRQRLEYLRHQFLAYKMFNDTFEIEQTKRIVHRDFYNVRKVDNHIHHSASMHQKHLLRFINEKCFKEGETVVLERAGEQVTLRKLFEDLGVHPWETTCDQLQVSALGGCFHRFDLFNAKYNPCQAPELRQVFLKTDNLLKGRYLAEITKEVLAQLKEHKYQHVEYRLSIYGTSKEEWKKLSCWVLDNDLFSPNVRWIIQIPRIYHHLKKSKLVRSFGQVLRNIFTPVIEAILRPQRHPEIFRFLSSVVGWDTVDDESRRTPRVHDVPPDAWDYDVNPPYSYWMYYLYANIKAINNLLSARKMNSKPFRPHCGEAGNPSHLGCAFLVADKINHGINLAQAPALQYLYYLRQIPISVAPISNNWLFKKVGENPLNKFFQIGLHVTVSTDDPLMLHFTNEPLMEEYSTACHIWKLSNADLCELARNSVIHSDFEHEIKSHWLGDCACTLKVSATEDSEASRLANRSAIATNVPPSRYHYRVRTYHEEIMMLKAVVNASHQARKEEESSDELESNED